MRIDRVAIVFQKRRIQRVHAPLHRLQPRHAFSLHLPSIKTRSLTPSNAKYTFFWYSRGMDGSGSYDRSRRISWRSTLQTGKPGKPGWAWLICWERRNCRVLKSSGISSEKRLSEVGVGNRSSSVTTCEFGREPDPPAGMDGSGEGVSLRGWDCVSASVCSD